MSNHSKISDVSHLVANPRTFLKLFLYVFLSILIGYGINQIPSIDIPLFVLILALVFCTALFYLVFEMDILNRATDRDSTLEVQRRLHQQLVNVVLRQVVERLERSLHHKTPLDLKRQEQCQRVGRRDLPPIEHFGLLDQVIRRVFNSFNTSAAPVLVAADISTADLLKRDDINGRLLILGEPGAGKTNELLMLAKELLQQARQADEASIPVIFELSEWSSGQGETFASWLIEQLWEKYDVPPKVSKQWIQQNQLLPLLDGLDELRRVDNAENASSEDLDRKRQARQVQCMRAINAFLDVHPSTSMVVCCRRKEYEALKAQGEYLKCLNGAIYLQALDDKQIKSYLNDLNRGALWENLKRQPVLLKLAQSPLFLLMLVVAYQGQPIQNTDKLLDLYIEKQLNDLNNRGAYSLEETHHYLSWLARKLEERGVTEFLIERLQPSWLDLDRDQRVYKLLSRLSFGLIGGLGFGLSFGLSSKLIGGLIGGVIGGLLGRLVGGLLDIKPKENLNFSYIAASSFGLRVGLGFGLIGGLSFGLIGGLRPGLIGGLGFGLSFGLIGGLLGGLTSFESETDEKKLPNQGIKQSARISMNVGLGCGLIGGLGLGLSFGLSGGLNLGLSFGLSLGLYFGLGFGLIFGLFQVIQHLCLRFVLYRSGVAPWNYEKFLEHAENHRFIQRVGGRYRFVHDLLRKRFAERYQPKWR